MNKEKQTEEKAIEEMAKVIEKTEQIARDAHCGLPSPRMYAKDLYWHGYRKRSRVAMEVLDEAIETVFSKIDMKIYNTIDGKPLGDHVAYGKQMAMYDVITLLAELKKKYTEGKE